MTGMYLSYKSAYYDMVKYVIISLVVLLSFVGDFRPPWLLFDVIFLISFLYAVYTKTLNKDLVSMFVLLGINLIFLGIQIYYFNTSILLSLRFYYNFRFIFIIYFLAQLIRNGDIDIKKLLHTIFIIGCIQFFINIPFIVREYLIDPADIDEHNGLFGNGSSHATGIFWTFLINYGLLKDKYKILTPTLILIAIFLSSLTDNKFFYVAMAFSIGTYMVKNPRLIYQTAVLVVLAIIILVISYKTIVEFQVFVDKAIFRTFDLYLNSDNNEKAERSLISRYILTLPESYSFGHGLGTVSHILNMDGKLINILLHISMNEMFIQVFETGFFNTIVLIFTFAYVYSYFWKENRVLVTTVMFILLPLMFYYSRFITDPRQIFFFTLIIICYSIPDLIEKKPVKKIIKRNPQIRQVPV